MAAESLVGMGFVLLNVGLAYVVGTVRPRRLVNTLVMALFLLNGIVAGLGVLRGAERLGSSTTLLEVVLDSQTFAILLFLPLVYPRARLPTRALVASAAIVSVALAALAVVASGALNVGATVLSPGDAPAVLVYDVVTLGAFVVGTLVLLDSYLGSRSDIQRDQARYFLAAYAMKLALIVGVVFRDGPGRALVSGDAPFAAVLAFASVLVALGAVPTALLVSRLRASVARPRADDVFVIAFPALMLLATGTLLFDSRIESLLLRPILVTYGMLRFQLLDVDVHSHRTVLVALVILAVAEVYAIAYSAVYSSLMLSEIDIGFAAGVALAASLGTLAAIAPPILRRLGGSSDAGARARAIYAAALEEAIQREGGAPAASSTDRVLRALRGRLQISEREHASMEAAARAMLAGDDVGPIVGYAYLGRYRVESVLGEGGFGRTFLARDEQVDRRVVLKVARVPGDDDARRLLAEGRLLARVRHPNIVTIFDVERVGDDCILVLEYVEGGSLADRLAVARPPPPEAMRIADDVLAALHARGIVHRDVKPGNVLLTPEGRAVLTDFGIARAPTGSGTAASYGLGGATAGTLRHMSPEQVRGVAVTPACDVYAVAVLLHEMLTGRSYLELDRRPDFDAARAIVEEEPPRPMPGLPPATERVLRAALAKDPAERPSAAQLRRHLAENVVRVV